MVERAGAFHEIQMPDGAFFDDFGFYGGQFACICEKLVQIALRVFVQFPVNLQSSAFHAIFAALGKECFPLLFRQPGNSIFKSLEPF